MCNSRGLRKIILQEIRDCIITDELLRRPSPPPDYRREALALRDLAEVMASARDDILPRLVDFAMQVCDGTSAGVSILEGDHFRWHATRGELKPFENLTVPRNSSPCGLCLEQDRPILMEHPERAYRWIADANFVVPEVLLIPLRLHGQPPMATIWIISREKGRFAVADVQIMTDLAIFAGIALHVVRTDTRLRAELEKHERVAREMTHRVKNVFALTSSIVRMSASSAGVDQKFVEILSARMTALAEAHGLAHQSVDGSAVTVQLRDLLLTVLRPYGTPQISGDDVEVGERTAASLALIFHELATNAVKYGALSSVEGRVSITWYQDGEHLQFAWIEQGGPPAALPTRRGLGSRLIESTATTLGGSFAADWQVSGLCACLRIPMQLLAW